ncbi:MAG TPA: LURP-one-related family protein [Candidatus Krumholzibacteriaceae bacterium]|nr:LURP-one-related family protein [Candidatus Krumholzibacteriaceae bacterium]
MSMLDHREFIVDQRLLTVRNTYVIKSKMGEQLGFIKQEFVSLGPKFWLEDNSSVHLGEIDGKVITVHHEYEIKDKDGQTRARIKKKILKLFGSEWWMEDDQGHEMARIKGNIVHHTYDIVAPDKSVIARVHLNWATVSDEYCVEIVRQDFDPLLVLGYAVAMDHVEHSERSQASTGIKTVVKLFGR